jgi:ABC-type dipeptide/oligopeptide/nickel transport system permease subunit
MGLTGKLSLAVILVVFVVSLAAPFIVRYDPDDVDLDSLRQPPSLRHLLGTDNKGRDILSRILHGGKISLSISLLAAIVSLTIGLSVGLVSGYAGGKADTVLMTLVDLVLSFPAFLLAIGISVVLPAGVYSVTIALSAVGWASIARLIRGHVLALRESLFIEAARALGSNDLRIIFVHLLPQCIPLALVIGGLKAGGYLLTEAGLSFLGLGAQPPTATWGSMISTGRAFINSDPWMVISPGIMIAVTAVSFNLLGDALKEKYDVRIEKEL